MSAKGKSSRPRQRRSVSCGAGVIPFHRQSRSVSPKTTFDLVPILIARRHRNLFLNRVDAAIEELKESLPLPKTG
jgi:molybdopterin synthase catalytic subunit